MVVLIRYIIIGLFSFTAASILVFQSIEIFHAFVDMFFNDYKSR